MGHGNVHLNWSKLILFLIIIIKNYFQKTSRITAVKERFSLPSKKVGFRKFQSNNESNIEYTKTFFQFKLYLLTLKNSGKAPSAYLFSSDIYNNYSLGIINIIQRIYI